PSGYCLLPARASSMACAESVFATSRRRAINTASVMRATIACALGAGGAASGGRFGAVAAGPGAAAAGGRARVVGGVGGGAAVGGGGGGDAAGGAVVRARAGPAASSLRAFQTAITPARISAPLAVAMSRALLVTGGGDQWHALISAMCAL